MHMTELTVDYHLLQKKGEESLEAVLEQLLEQGVEELKIVSVFMTRGFEYSRMRKRVLACKRKFKKLMISDPVLKGRKKISSFADFLIDEYKIDKNANYIFVGHGLPESKNREYFLLEKFLKKKGWPNARIFMLKGKSGSLEDFEKTAAGQGVKTVTVIPLLIGCGKHIKEDIFGEENSFCADLESRGFQVEKRIVSLGMSERFKVNFLR